MHTSSANAAPERPAPLPRPAGWAIAAAAGALLAAWALPQADRALAALAQAREVERQAAPPLRQARFCGELATMLSAQVAGAEPITAKTLLAGLLPEDQAQITPAGGPQRVGGDLTVEEYRLTLRALPVEALLRVIHQIDRAAPAWKVSRLQTYAPAAGEGIDAEMVVQHLSRS